MAWIWTLFLFFSICTAVQTGQTAELSNAVLTGAEQGISLGIRIAGPLCLWNGLVRVTEACGAVNLLSRLTAPILQRLFPQAWSDRIARDALCGNLAANFLGLGNAATPLGIRAVRQMALHTDGHVSDELCRLIVMNTASIQLIPSTVAAARASLGAASAFDILPAVWITSLCSVTAGLLAAKGLSRWVR